MIPGLPTGVRGITIEQLVRHLIVEHGISPLSSSWKRTLSEAEAFFADIQKKRFTR